MDAKLEVKALERLSDLRNKPGKYDGHEYIDFQNKIEFAKIQALIELKEAVDNLTQEIKEIRNSTIWNRRI